MTSRTMTFEIGLGDFDLELLPEYARDVNSDSFRTEVTKFFKSEFTDLGGEVEVNFVSDRIQVRWQSVGAVSDLFEDALHHLNRGRLREAVPLLRALVAVEQDNTDAHYNLGMALSDLGDLEKAQLHLLKVVHRDPENVNALVALGIALHRSGDLSGARRRLEQALEKEPSNGYAHRNLAAILGNEGESDTALHHMREAHRLLPNDQMSVFGLAHALEEFGGENDLAEADELYKAAIDLNASSEIAEHARRARSRIAQSAMRSAAPDIRMDAVMYCLGALERFESMTHDEVQAVGFEIAMLGRQGLDINDPESKYQLRSLPGEYSGLHLVSLMYTAFQQIAPHLDVGVDLSKEYEAAVNLKESRKQSN